MRKNALSNGKMDFGIMYFLDFPVTEKHFFGQSIKLWQKKKHYFLVQNKILIILGTLEAMF
jgi:hypothetical protein